MPSRKLQDADFKTEADLGAASRLLNDSKIYVTSVAKTLDDAIADGDIAGAPVFEHESITLSAGDISAQYVDLGFEAVASGVFVRHNRMSLEPTDDFTTSVVAGPVTRITFAGDFATGGSNELQENDILKIDYVRA